MEGEKRTRRSGEKGWRRFVPGRRRSFAVLLAILLPLAFDLGFFAAGLLPETRSPEQIAPVDLIVVPTGGQGRLREALQFLQNGRGKFLFISGTAPDAQLSSILKANRIDEFPVELRQRILLGDESRSTLENAIEIRKIAEKLRARSILFVTSAYHMRRALGLLETEFRKPPEFRVLIAGYPVESPNFARDTWWKGWTGWRILFSEYYKSLPSRWL